MALIVGAQRLGGVLDQGHAVVAGRRRAIGVEVGALAEEVDEHHGLWQVMAAGAAGQRRRQEIRVHIPGLAFAVEEGGMAAQVDHGVGAGGESQRRNQDLIAGADAGQQQGQVEGCGAGAGSEGIGCARGDAELRLERVHIGPEWRDPVAGEGLFDVLPFEAGEVRRREKDAWHSVPPSFSCRPA